MSIPKLFPEHSIKQNLVIYFLLLVIVILFNAVLHKYQMRGMEEAFEKGCNPHTMNEVEWTDCVRS